MVPIFEKKTNNNNSNTNIKFLNIDSKTCGLHVCVCMYKNNLPSLKNSLTLL